MCCCLQFECSIGNYDTRTNCHQYWMPLMFKFTCFDWAYKSHAKFEKARYVRVHTPMREELRPCPTYAGQNIQSIKSDSSPNLHKLSHATSGLIPQKVCAHLSWECYLGKQASSLGDTWGVTSSSASWPTVHRHEKTTKMREKSYRNMVTLGA